jgi:POT family proton-dependent oligopeptide transporter
MALFTIFFWMAFEQAGNTMTLWADQNTRRHLLGWEVPASWFQSVNPFFIFALAPVLSMLWLFIARRWRDISSTSKFVLGLAFLGAGFVVMVMAATAAGGDKGQVSAMWLVFAYLLHTVGELCLSPIGLSLVTKLAPVRLGGMLMGVWFLAVFAGNWIAGKLGTLWSSYTHVTFFSIFVVTSLAASVMLFFLRRPLKRMMAGAA